MRATGKGADVPGAGGDADMDGEAKAAGESGGE